MPIRPRAVAVLSLAALLLGAGRGAAGAQVELAIDNDLFGVRGPDDAPPDYEYTHGTRLAWRSGRVGRLSWLCGAPSIEPAGAAAAFDSRVSDGCGMRFQAGQRIYTPRRDAAQPLPGERPYAGWLFAGAAVERVTEGAARTIGIEIGVTGPPSLAEPVQTTLHRLAGYSAPLGWEHQLRTEPAVALRYEESRTVLRLDGPVAASVEPRWDAAVGTLRTAAGAGVRTRVGAREGARGVFLFAGARGEWVGRDLFLDGNTFRSGPRVEKRPFVGEADAGFGVRVRRFELRYSTVFRGREYRTQDEPHRYGSIVFVLHPRRIDRDR